MTQLRKVKKRQGFPAPVKLAGVSGTVGLVVDLCYVDDLQEAKILSWAAAANIDTMVVKNMDTARLLFEKGVKAWALNQIFNYKVRRLFFIFMCFGFIILIFN